MIWAVLLGAAIGSFATYVIRDVYETVFVRTRRGVGELDHTRLSRGDK